MKILITGGAGFIGSALIRHLIRHTSHEIVNLDKLSYAGSLASLCEAGEDPRHVFECADICDARALSRVFDQHHPTVVMHLAAETHVDRSIDDPAIFVQTNIVGTQVLLEAARRYWSRLDETERRTFRFLHVSTDEVYGDLGAHRPPATESSPYAPSSPYAASKAAADHLTRAWHRSYGLPILVTNGSNTYGPRQYPEKLIPHIIMNAIEGRPLPIYGDGLQVRDWLYVEDHARALMRVLEYGEPGESYHIGARNEQKNLDIVHAICAVLDELAPRTRPRSTPHRQAIVNVQDRPGHDTRYAIDTEKIRLKLGWSPQEAFGDGLRKTVEWYLDNMDWCRRVAPSGSPRAGLGRV